MRDCAADMAGTLTAIAIRTPTEKECAILDMVACLAAGVPSGVADKWFAYINLAKPVGMERRER